MAIITLAEYKTYKSINSTTQDTQIQAIIDSVNSHIVSYCNRTFNDYYSSNKTEYFDSDIIELYPLEYPLVSIISVKTSTDGGQNYDTTLANFTDYAISINTSSIKSLKDGFVITSYPNNAIEVIYNGGYLDIPDDLKLAAVNFVDYFLGEEYTPAKMLSGARVDNLNISTTSPRIPPHIRRVLEHYRSGNP